VALGFLPIGLTIGGGARLASIRILFQTQYTFIYATDSQSMPTACVIDEQGNTPGVRGLSIRMGPDTASRGTSKPRFQAGIRAREIKRIAFP